MPQVLDNAEQLRKALANIDVDAQTYMRESLRRALLSAFNEGIAFSSEAAANPKSMHAKFQSARYRSLIGQIRATLGEWNSAAAQQTGVEPMAKPNPKVPASMQFDTNGKIVPN
jgi:hypothetical protein